MVGVPVTVIPPISAELFDLQFVQVPVRLVMTPESGVPSAGPTKVCVAVQVFGLARFTSIVVAADVPPTLNVLLGEETLSPPPPLPPPPMAFEAIPVVGLRITTADPLT